MFSSDGGTVDTPASEAGAGNGSEGSTPSPSTLSESFIRRCRKQVMIRKIEYGTDWKIYTNAKVLEQYLLPHRRGGDIITFESRPWLIDNALADNVLVFAINNEHHYFYF